MFARLEYGKMCVSAQGPIADKMEAGALAWSPEFPAHIRDICTAVAWGIAEDFAAIEAARHFGGTIVVAPAFAPDGVIRLGAHFRRRPEPGEGEPGRQFWRACFLCDGSGRSGVAELGLALSARTLFGWTHDESATPVAAVATPPLELPAAGLDAWYDRAVRAVERRIPIGIRAPMATAQFWALAGGLEAALPPKLRPVFSAGWGVAPGHATRVALSCATEFPPGVAVYDLQAHAWTHDPTGLARPRPEATHVALVPSTKTRLLFLGDGEVQRWIHTFEREADVERRLRSVRAWLHGDRDDRALPWLDAGDDLLGFGEMVDEIVHALDDAARAPRAEELLLALWRGARRREVVERARSTRARLLVALAQGDAAALLDALRAAVEEVGPWTRSKLLAGLEATLIPTSAVAAAHAALLGDPAALAQAPAYGQWAIRRARELALILGSLAPEPAREHAMGALAERSGTPEVALIRDVLYQDPDSVDVARLASMADTWRPLLVELARRRWGSPATATASGRAAALRWLEALSAAPDDALLGTGPPTAADVSAIADALREVCVPERLLDALALRTLRFWPSFRAAVGRAWWPWEPVLARLPPALVKLLVPPAEVREPRAVHAEVTCELGVLALPRAELESIGRDAARGGAFETAGAAGLFVELCRRADAQSRRQGAGASFAQAGLVDTVNWLWHGGEAVRITLEPELVLAVAALAHHIPVPTRDKVARWRRARTSDELLLLLRIFDGPVEDPSVRQLEGLLGRERELRLLRETSGSAQRWQPFAVCTLGWQGVDVRTDGRSYWRAEYRGTLLSGAFAGLPRHDEAPFRDLLDAFARYSGRNTWDLAAQYLRLRGEQAGVDGTRDVIWREVIEAACLMAGVAYEQFESVIRFSEDADPRRSTTKIERSEYATDAVTVIGDSILLHPTFAALLQQLGNSECRRARLASYREPFLV